MYFGDHIKGFCHISSMIHALGHRYRGWALVDDAVCVYVCISWKVHEPL